MPRNSAEALNELTDDDFSDDDLDKPYMNARGEPNLNDLLSDSATHAVMASDDVRHDELVTLIELARASLAGRA